MLITRDEEVAEKSGGLKGGGLILSQKALPKIVPWQKMTAY